MYDRVESASLDSRLLGRGEFHGDGFGQGYYIQGGGLRVFVDLPILARRHSINSIITYITAAQLCMKTAPFPPENAEHENL